MINTLIVDQTDFLEMFKSFNFVIFRINMVKFQRMNY